MSDTGACITKKTKYEGKYFALALLTSVCTDVLHTRQIFCLFLVFFWII